MEKEPEAAFEAAVVGLQAASGVAPEALEAVDRHLAVDQGLVVVDAPVVEPVERQRVIGLPAVGVDDRVQLELPSSAARSAALRPRISLE